MDFFHTESDNFERDLHVIILGSLHASVNALSADTEAYAKKLETQIESAHEEYRDYLIDRQGEAFGDHAEQERFQRNMAFVAIATRLIHALRTMLRSAETFFPRKKKYGDGSMSEIMRLWSEIGERFGIDIVMHADKIAFATPLNDVRNQIVHDGGEANPQLPFERWTLEGGDASYLDLKFSDKYPEYVDGSGFLAAVRVTEEQFNKIFDDSITLIKWLAAELRACELAAVKVNSASSP
ncbi:hypothetical protein [Edaphobacter modestus]|nr:hypothetical protein [Edaphobacter modestus]